jgi:tRNA pseudouridine38-40 synthase
MPSYKITLAYDGTDFVGWQRQAKGVSVQGLIEDALRTLDGRDVDVSGAGRTDAGVHALGQVAAFTIARELGPIALVRALNAHLPHAVRVLTAEDAPPMFHPRFGARTKTYQYRLWNGDVMSPFERRYAWHVPGPLDVEAMRAAARLLEGSHDFAAFQASGSSVATTEREITCSRVIAGLKPCATSDLPEVATDACGAIDTRGAGLQPCEPLIVYEVTGTGFLRHMVRIIVGSLLEIGRGRQPVEWISGAIVSRNRTTAGPTAPPDGLFLVRVEYADALAAGS